MVQDLRTACGILATIAEQYRIDGYGMRFLGLKELGRKFYPGWHQDIECHLNLFIKQILRFEDDPLYPIGALQAGAADIRGVLRRDREAATSAFNALCAMRTRAWNVRADRVPDLFEHAVDEVQHQVEKLEQIERIVAGIGPADFVGALFEI